MGTRVICGTLLFCFFGNLNWTIAAANPDPTDAFFTNHTIPRIRIQLDQDALAALRNKFREYTKATVMEGTNVWREVGIHLKGQYGTFQGIDGRPSLTLNFDKYQKQHLIGLRDQAKAGIGEGGDGVQSICHADAAAQVIVAVAVGYGVGIDGLNGVIFHVVLGHPLAPKGVAHDADHALVVEPVGGAVPRAVGDIGHPTHVGEANARVRRGAGRNVFSHPTLTAETSSRCPFSPCSPTGWKHRPTLIPAWASLAKFNVFGLSFGLPWLVKSVSSVLFSLQLCLAPV